MSAVSLHYDATQRDIEDLRNELQTLEANVINEFRALARYRQDQSLAPIMNRLERIEAALASIHASFASKSQKEA